MSQLPIAFVDLDDTLFSTRRKHRNTPEEQLVAAARNAQGQAASFMNPTQLAFWNWLESVARVIPTTARTSDSFARVMLSKDTYAICAAGAVVLTPNGEIDEAWKTLVSHRINQDDREPLERLLAGIGRKYQHSFDRMSEHGEIVFYRLRSAHRDQSLLRQIHETLHRELPEGWTTHLTNHDVSILRNGCQKRDAIAWLLEKRLGECPFTIGIGDSLADIDFLAECDFAMGPRSCQWLQQLDAFHSATHPLETEASKLQ